MRLLFAILLTCGALPVLATTFTVTSNQDNGLGTLRDAILQANANGATTPDIINFNIADQTQAGRTITLASLLPVLTGNLTIDGTTQPGTAFGISNARVIITTSFVVNNNDFFQFSGVSNMQFYGLWLKNSGANNCFHFTQAQNLQFGAPGKGNLIQGFAKVFYCDFGAGGSGNITVQGNIMGTDPTGATADATTLNITEFWLRNVSNLQIGGLNPGEGNLMVEQGAPMDYSSSFNNSFGFINIEGNIQGTDITGLIRLSPNHYYFSIDGWDDGTQALPGASTARINVLNNISVGGFGFFEIGGPIIVQGNHLGVGADNVTNIINNSPGDNGTLVFSSCAQALVGGPGPADKNYIGYGSYGVYEYYSGNITISRNSFFCNGTGIAFSWTLERPIPVANITGVGAGSVSGTALPNSTIELFYDDQCAGCEGKTYIGATTADNNGNWSYSLAATGAIVATATDTYGATSAFSTATVNTKQVVVTNATCGRNNGSIKNIAVTSGTEWQWQDANGNIVGINTDLTNVGPGTYTFVTSIGGATCGVSSTPYTVAQTNLPSFDPANITITQPGCGQNNGSLNYSGVFDPATTYSWSSAGVTITPDYSAANPLSNLAPGVYTLQLALKQDPTCPAQYGPFTLVNTTGPSLITTSVATVASICAKDNGSLTGMTYENAIPPVYFAWQNDQGATIATTLSLIHVYAGNYRFVFKDGGSCDTIFSTYYTIPDNGGISYDTSKMVITPATCDLPNGSIVGIMSGNAETYTWTNIVTNPGSSGPGTPGPGAVVGDLEDLISIDAGLFQLTMSNAYGCTAQTPGFTVRQLGYPAAPQVEAQHIPRNTSATITVINPQANSAYQPNGTYELLDGPTPAATILDSSSSGVLHTPNVAQNETLYVVFTNHICTSPPAPVNIKVFDSLKIYIPNAFTPNAGANARWHILVQSPTKNLQVNVYDRWGAIVFQSTDPNLAWDGTNAGHPLSGAFVYIIAGTDYFNRPFQYKGTLMIIR